METLLSEQQRRGLGALVLFRLFTVTVLLGSTTYVNWHSGQIWNNGQVVLSLAIGVVYLISILYLLAIKVNASYRLQATTQVFVDLLFWSGLIYLTEGMHSPFVFLYSLSIIQGAYLLGRRGAWLSFATALILFLILLWAEKNKILMDVLGITPSFLNPYDVSNLYIIFMNVTMLLLVTFLAGYLATQLRDREDALRRERLSLEMQRMLNRSIVTGLSSGFVILDPQGAISFLNVAAETMLNLSFSAARGRGIVDLVPALAPLVMRELRGDREDRHCELRLAQGDAYRQVFVTSSDLLGLDNARMGTILMLEDVTARRQLEERARRSEKLAAVGELAAGIAHEIRNPLASISGSIQMLQREAATDDDSRKLMEISLREIDRLNQLINDFLAFARPRPLDPKPVNLREIFEDITSLLGLQSDNSEVRLRVEIASELPEIAADPGQLRQLLWNIIKNAVEAARHSHPAIVWIKLATYTRDRGDWLLCEIRDNGPGMSPEVRARLFDPFFTTKPGGTGLGMSIVHQAVRAHGGVLELDSVEGGGTLVRVLLPAVPPLHVDLTRATSTNLPLIARG